MLHAYVTRSSTIAITTIAIPPLSASRRPSACSPSRTVAAQAARADDRRDHDHAQRHHDGLVDAEHDRGLRHRELHLAQRSAAASTPNDPDDLERRRRHAADPQAGEPDRGRQREDHASRSSPWRADAEQQHERQEVRERGHRLHRVQHRTQDLSRPGRCAGPDPERDADQQRDADGRRRSAPASPCSTPTAPAAPSRRTRRRPRSPAASRPDAGDGGRADDHTEVRHPVQDVRRRRPATSSRQSLMGLRK